MTISLTYIGATSSVVSTSGGPDIQNPLTYPPGAQAGDIVAFLHHVPLSFNDSGPSLENADESGTGLTIRGTTQNLHLRVGTLASGFALTTIAQGLAAWAMLVYRPDADCTVAAASVDVFDGETSDTSFDDTNGTGFVPSYSHAVDDLEWTHAEDHFLFLGRLAVMTGFFVSTNGTDTNSLAASMVLEFDDEQMDAAHYFNTSMGLTVFDGDVSEPARTEDFTFSPDAASAYLEAAIEVTLTPTVPLDTDAATTLDLRLEKVMETEPPYNVPTRVRDARRR